MIIVIMHMEEWRRKQCIEHCEHSQTCAEPMHGHRFSFARDAEVNGHVWSALLGFFTTVREECIVDWELKGQSLFVRKSQSLETLGDGPQSPAFGRDRFLPFDISGPHNQGK